MKNEEKFNTGFKSCENKGFQITFENGWTISVQFGKGNYCERRSFDENAWQPEAIGIVQSANAECAVWDADGNWLDMDECDQVVGWQTPDEVATLIARVAAFRVGYDVLDENETRTDIPVYEE